MFCLFFSATEEGVHKLWQGVSPALYRHIGNFVGCLSLQVPPTICGPDQTAPIGAVCSGSTLFASTLNWSVMLGNYLQQMTFSDAFFMVL